MYICICNALTDLRLKTAIRDNTATCPTEVYAACGCRAKCGKCVEVVKQYLREHADGPEAGLPSSG